MPLGNIVFAIEDLLHPPHNTQGFGWRPGNSRGICDAGADSVWLQGCDGEHEHAQKQESFHCKVVDFALSRESILARLSDDSYASIAHMSPELIRDKIISRVSQCPVPH